MAGKNEQKKGSVTTVDTVKQDSAIDALALLGSSTGDIMAALEKAEQARPEDYQKEASDYWKPTKVGETLNGVFLGEHPDSVTTRYIQWGFGSKNPGPGPNTGKPMLVKVPGSRILTKELKKRQPGEIARLTYKGSSTTQGGQNVNLFDVEWLTGARVDVAPILSQFAEERRRLEAMETAKRTLAENA